MIVSTRVAKGKGKGKDGKKRERVEEGGEEILAEIEKEALADPAHREEHEEKKGGPMDAHGSLPALKPRGARLLRRAAPRN